MKKLLLSLLIIAPFNSLSSNVSVASATPFFITEKSTKDVDFFNQTKIQFPTDEQPFIEIHSNIEMYYHMPTPVYGLQFDVGVVAGSLGLLAHGVGRWVLYPDFGNQPALGILGDVYSGLSLEDGFVAGFSGGGLLSKTFNIESRSFQSITAYIIPSVQAEKTSDLLFSWLVAGGLQSKIETSLIQSSPFYVTIEAQYSSEEGALGSLNFVFSL